MLTYLFFQPSLEGHYLEYLHHEYLASGLKEGCKFVYIVPEGFKNNKLIKSWPLYNNIEFVYLSSLDYSKCNQSSFIKRSLAQSRLIRKYCILYGATHCFLNSLVNAMPLLPFLLPKGCKVSGILYGIYRWNENELSAFKLLFDRYLFKLYSNQKIFKNVYLLNDYDSSVYFNNKFFTSVFSYLPDPINISDNYKPDQGLRAKLGIADNDQVYLQLGVQQRKHPFEILKAIRLMTEEQLSNKVLIFTGVTEDAISDRFASEISSLCGRVRIILKTGRVPFEELYDLFNISDYCFVLYDNTNMSSGVIGYAAYFNTKVIGVNKGLLGFLINKYNLGICVDEITQDQISKAMLDILDYPTSANNYVEVNSIDCFVKTIFNNFNNKKKYTICL